MKKLLLVTLLVLFSTQTFALTAQERGLQIIVEVDRRDTGFGDTKATLNMRLIDRTGNESLRSLKIKTLEVVNDGDKSLIIFSTPRDIKGTAFLSYTHALVSDEQWLYLPALKRVKRISSSNKSGPFLGSEYAFEDLTSFEVAKYNYKYLRNETIEGIACYVLELIPNYKHSGYTRELIWIDQARYIAIKVEYYDRKESLLKTQTFKNYKQYLNQYWRAGEQVMTNHQNGKSTELLWEDYQFGMGLTDRDFDKNTLKRAR
ncbi:MAG TPA: outer membrane lipoprotein-sorting protein [Methylococcaceae bacterium]|nr:outer membrane lipoprotein-sorting protein [Methylococcaceae bacterium]